MNAYTPPNLPKPGTRIGPYEVLPKLYCGITPYAVIREGSNTGVEVILVPRREWYERGG
jgi:hypothetical protein